MMKCDNIVNLHRVYEDKDEMVRSVGHLASTIASKSPLVVRGTKEIIRYTRDHTVQDSLHYMGTFNAAFLLSDDLKESFEAQVMKREPKYHD